MGKGFGISTKAQLDMASVNQVKKEFTTLIRDLQNLANRNYINIRVNQSSQEMQRFNNQINNTRNNLNNVNNAMNDLNGSNRTFAQQMTHVISKVAQWTLGMTAVYGTIRKVKEGFSFIADIDKKLTDISMITNKSKEELQDYAKSWNDTAIALKTTTDEVVDAEEKYLRAGKSIDEASKMTETNIKLARIANDSNEQTAESLVTLSNAYKLNADGVERYANKVAYLDSSTATNTKNINRTSTAVAQTAQETGMSMDFMLGIVSTIQEKSKQAPESIGRALRSMLINMQNVTKEGEAELSKLEEILNKRGIALRKNEKEWRSSEAIIKDLMANWNKFDDISKSAIQSKLAGKVGAEAFNIIMNDQTRVMENYNNALNATNTLDEKYEKHLSSTAGATAELQAKTEKMWLKLIDSSTITNSIKLLTKTVTIIDQLVNHNKLLGAGLVALSVQFVGLIKGVNLFGMALTALKGVGLATFKALATNPLTWIAVAIGGIIALTSHLRNQREETEKLTQEDKDLHKN
ncbi:MAG: phage tail tape measure protein, partial [Clostridium sp.]|nr:phage tail tape measure protein [Clostridium sp.]